MSIAAGVAFLIGYGVDRGADGGVESVFVCKSVVFLEKRQRLLVGKISRVFRKGLRGDAQRLHFESGFFVRGFDLC